MATDINKIVLVGRLTRDADQSYTQSGFALLKFSLAVNRSKKQGDGWTEEAHFFDCTVFGRQGEAIAAYMTKGKQVAVEGCLKQDRWEAQDGTKRSKVSIDVNNVQLLGGKSDGQTAQQAGGSGGNVGQDPAALNPGTSRQSMNGQPPQGPPSSFEEDIPF